MAHAYIIERNITMSKESIGALRVILIIFAIIGFAVAAYFVIKKIRSSKAKKDAAAFDELDDLEFDEDDFCDCCDCDDDIDCAVEVTDAE